MFKKIFKLFMIIFFIYALFLFLESDFFLIRKVEIYPKNSLIKKDILDKFNNLKKKSIIFVDSKKLNNIISNDIRVEKIKISKKYPDTINIFVEDKKAIGLIYLDGKYFYIDNKFNVFAYYEELEVDDLPIINLPKKEDFEKFEKVLKNLSKTSMYKSISEIYVENAKIYFVLLDGTLVYTNEDVSIKKYEKAYEIYKLEKVSNNLEYIDLRFKDIIIK